MKKGDQLGEEEIAQLSSKCDVKFEFITEQVDL